MFWILILELGKDNNTVIIKKPNLYLQIPDHVEHHSKITLTSIETIFAVVILQKWTPVTNTMQE